MTSKHLTQAIMSHYREGRRFIAPLMGFPGLSMTGGNIKLAQQNYGEHYKVVKELANEFKPDLAFPLMDLAVEANAVGQYTLFPKQESATVVKEHFDFEELITALCEFATELIQDAHTRLSRRIEPERYEPEPISRSRLSKYALRIALRVT